MNWFTEQERSKDAAAEVEAKLAAAKEEAAAEGALAEALGRVEELGAEAKALSEQLEATRAEEERCQKALSAVELQISQLAKTVEAAAPTCRTAERSDLARPSIDPEDLAYGRQNQDSRILADKPIPTARPGSLAL